MLPPEDCYLTHTQKPRTQIGILQTENHFPQEPTPHVREAVFHFRAASVTPSQALAFCLDSALCPWDWGILLLAACVSLSM